MQAQQQNTNSLNQAPQPPTSTQATTFNQVGMPSYFEIKLNKAMNFKNDGNDFFKAQKFAQARGKYQQALQLLQPVSFAGASQNECNHMVTLSATLLYNLGTCFYNENRWRDGQLIYNQAITINPNYVKALYKRALCRFSLNQYEGAMQDIKQAYNLDKSNEDIRQSYEKIREKYNEQIRKDNQKRKELSSKIFNPGALDKSQSKTEKQEEEIKGQEEQKEGKPWWLLSFLPLAAAVVYQGIKYFRNN